MRILVLLFAVAMPIVAWMTNNDVFGPDNGTMSDRYPTLLVAAGYAFAIWGLIFLGDLVYAVWQATGTRKTDATLSKVAPWAAAGFALTTVWMPLFAMSQFWLCLFVIFAALACLLKCALILSADGGSLPRQRLFAWLPLSLHAGWLAVAAFLNLAQVIVAYRLLPTGNMLPWSLVLFGMAALLLLAANQRMRGNLPFAFAAIWGLAAVFVKQRGAELQGGTVAAWTALAIATVLAAHTLFNCMRRRNP